MKYYQLRDDMEVPGRWVLDDPLDEAGQEVDPWCFEEGVHLDWKGLFQLHQAHAGRALDFSSTTLGVPVVHARVVSLFERLLLGNQVQFFPAQVEGQAEPYFLLNALNVIRCIDDRRSERVEYWRPEDHRPDKEGQYRVVSGMRIEPSRVGEAHLFRPWGWRVALIVSEHLKQALEQEGITGTWFIEV